MTRREEFVLLVGNGINNIGRAFTWMDLIHDLLKFSGAAGRIHLDGKPFPLLYEEIFLNGIKHRKLSEAQLKAFIAERVLSLVPYEIHERIMGLKPADILTTNYDYTLEGAAGLTGPAGFKNGGVVTENTYSLFRFIRTEHTRVWHIHGECHHPQTINLGYEQYSGYLQQMRNYVVKGTGDTYKASFESLVRRLARGDVGFDSWIDFFFTKDVYILGLTLDFIEIHLWWLLTYRARRKYKEAKAVDNRIVYFYPAHYAQHIRQKLELLKINDVTPVALKMAPGKSEDYYRRALDWIRRSR